MHNFLRSRIFSLGLSACLLAGCNQGGGDGSSTRGSSAGDEFVVGVAAPYTGDSSQFGIQIRRGVELYAEQLNEKGGIDGRKIVLDFKDDAGRVDQAQTVATTLASDESVLAVIGHFNSSCSLAGKSIYQSAGVVQFSPGSTNVDVTRDTDYTYRNIFTDEFQGISLATYTKNVLQKQNVAILYDNDDYGTGLKDSYKQEAEKLGLNVVVEQAYEKNAPDFRAQIKTIQGQQTAPDVILIAGLYTQAANIARQARDLGLNAQFIGGDGVFSQQYITLGGEAVEGSIISCPFLFDLGGEKATEFAEAFREKYDEEPDAWAALSYDAIDMVCEGFRRNGFSRDAVLEYLKTLDSPDNAHAGVVGATFFDEEGDSKRPVQMAQVEGGKFVAADMQLSPEGQPVPVAQTGAAEAPAVPAATAAQATPAATPQNTPAPTPEPTPQPTPSPTATAIPETVLDAPQDVTPPPADQPEPSATPEPPPAEPAQDASTNPTGAE